MATCRLLELGVSRADITLLFTDTMVEDEELYVFLHESTKALGLPITVLRDGRTIWEVFKDRRFLGNSRVDPCSEELKRKLSRQYVQQFSPDEVIVCLGFDWNEQHRLAKATSAWNPYQVIAPMCNPPYIDKEEFPYFLPESVKLPRLYEMGFSHNNCGGGCVKAGIGHFLSLLEKFPERYALWERNEKEVIEALDKPVSILTRTVGGVSVPFTLEQLRIERQGLSDEERGDVGGCGCFDEQ